VVAAAYRALMKKYHPDVKGSSERARDINEAYETLSDSRKREEYYRRYLQNQKQNTVIVERVERGPSYISRKSDLQKKAEELEKREEELKQKEFQLKIKMKLMDEFSRYSKNSEVNQIQVQREVSPHKNDHPDFSTTSDFNEVLEKLKNMGKEKVPVIRQILKSGPPLSRESALYDILLEEKEGGGDDLLEGAFKFKHLYHKLFCRIAARKLTRYQSKVASVVNNLNFKLESHQELLTDALEVYREIFPTKDLLEFLFTLEKLILKDKIYPEIREKILPLFWKTVGENQFQELFKLTARQFLKEEKTPKPVKEYLAEMYSEN
jgi:hypothetical protein